MKLGLALILVSENEPRRDRKLRHHRCQNENHLQAGGLEDDGREEKKRLPNEPKAHSQLRYLVNRQTGLNS